MTRPSYTAAELAEKLDAELMGDPVISLDSLEELGKAKPGQLTFIGHPAYAAQWATTQASAALVNRDLRTHEALADVDGRALLFVDNADLAMAEALELYAPAVASVPVGVHPSAVVDPSAVLGDDVRIGPGAVVGPGVALGDRVVMHAHAVALDHASIGADTVLWPGAVVRDRCTVGQRCVLHPNCVIGADGFGFRGDTSDPQRPRIVKVPQIGTVVLGDEVDVGANTCIDRAKFGVTLIESMVKLDNLVQIGHNCRIGMGTCISGCTGIAGSCDVGRFCLIGGHAGLADHTTMGDRCKLAGSSHLKGEQPAGTDYAGTPAKPVRQAFKEMAAIERLPDLIKKARKFL